MKHKILAAAVVVLLVAASGVAWAQSTRELDRLGGGDRFGTAILISQEAFPDGALEVFLARADNPVDALPGSALTRRGPILYVPQCGPVPQAVIDEVNRLKPFKVTALGGPNTICQEVLDQFAGPAGEQPPNDEVTRSGTGDLNTDPFRLSGGSYRVIYDYSSDCSYSVSMDDTGGDSGKFEILPGGEGPMSGEDNLFNVPPGEWYIDMSTFETGDATSCPWSITLRSQ